MDDFIPNFSGKFLGQNLLVVADRYFIESVHGQELLGVHIKNIIATATVKVGRGDKDISFHEFIF